MKSPRTASSPSAYVTIEINASFATKYIATPVATRATAT